MNFKDNIIRMPIKGKVLNREINFRKSQKARRLVALKCRFIKEAILLNSQKLDGLIFQLEHIQGQDFCCHLAEETMNLNYVNKEDWYLEKKLAFIDKVLFHFKDHEASQLNYNSNFIHPLKGDCIMTALFNQ